MDSSTKILITNSIASIAVLGGTVALLLFGGPNVEQRHRDIVVSAPQAETPKSFEPPTAARLDQFNDLSWQGVIRREELVSPAGSGQVNRPNLRLVNLIVSDSNALAVFDRPPDTKRLTVAVGERIDSGVVTEITDDRVMLVVGSETFEYRLE